MPVPCVVVAGVQPLEQLEDPLGVIGGSMPMPLSATENATRSSRIRAADDLRACGSVGANLRALPIRFWNSWPSCVRVALDRGQARRA